jgi:hypothetical protein
MSVVENTREPFPSSGFWSVDSAHSTIESCIKDVISPDRQWTVRRLCRRLCSVSRVGGTGGEAQIPSYARTGDGEPATGAESLLYPIDAPS